MMKPDPKAKAQDPADSYERAQPDHESPDGKLDRPKGTPEKEEDHLQRQNEAPDEPKVKKP